MFVLLDERLFSGTHIFVAACARCRVVTHSEAMLEVDRRFQSEADVYERVALIALLAF